MGSRFNNYNKYPRPYGIPKNVDIEFNSITSANPDAIFIESQIKVSYVQGSIDKYHIEWPKKDADSYIVTISFCPLKSQKVYEFKDITTTKYEYTHSEIFPNDVFPYVWVDYVKNGVISTIQAFPGTLENRDDTFSINKNPLEQGYANVIIDNDYMRFILQELKRREIALLQNDGEPFILYVKRWTGKKCKCTYSNPNLIGGDSYYGYGLPTTVPADNNSNPSYEGVSQCELCFGTGIAGGYYHAIPLIARYGEIPTKIRLYKEVGIEYTLDFNTWTLWDPRWHEHDLLYRPLTQEYYELTSPKYGSWRGIPLHQQSTLKAIPRKDIRYRVIDTSIDAGITANG